MRMLQQAQDDGKARARTLEVMNTVLTDLLQLYNCLAGEVLAHDPDRLPDALPAGDDVFAWAAAAPHAWRATDAEEQALMTGVDADLPPPGQVLPQALMPRWRVSASLRQQRG